MTFQPANEQEFRDNSELRNELKVILEHPTFQIAARLIRIQLQDMPLDAPEVASVRYLSHLSGFNEYLVRLASLTVPPAPVIEELQPDWGTDENK